MILLFGLAACTWVDLNDCRVTDPEHCEVFRPEGYLCALAHTGFRGHPGSGCEPPVESDDAYAIFTPLRCPEGYVLGRAADSEAGDIGVYGVCSAEGNASASSGDLAEVPRGAACGFNHGNSGGSQNLCMGENPGIGECPEGTSLHWSYDIHGTTSGGGPLDVQADFLVWCEVGDGGCAAEECPPAPTPICGIHGNGLNASDTTWLDNIVWDTLDDRLEAVIRGMIEAGDIPEGSCDGLPEGECPAGMVLACTEDLAGNKTDHETILTDALCWCAAPENVRDPGVIELRRED